MHNVVRRMSWTGENRAETEPLLTREWLVTNGLGGYASGTVSGALTRRYHGLLIAALSAPTGRVVMLSHLSEQLRFAEGNTVQIGGAEHAEGELDLPVSHCLIEVCLEAGLPIWRYKVDDVVLEKQLLLPHGQNTVYVIYRLVSGLGPVYLELRPSMHFRAQGAPVDQPLHEPYTLTIVGEQYEITAAPEFPPLRLHFHGVRAALTVDRSVARHIFYRTEARRGYAAHGVLWSPGYFSAELHHEQNVVLLASTEEWSLIHTLRAEEALAAERERRQRLLAAAAPVAQQPTAAELVLAADQFIITPAGRVEDAARGHAAGDEVRTIIAGYHWFTDWGRDTMIALEGLTLTTGRQIEAGWTLRNFARYIRDGLIPNLFPEGDNQGLYHTADATLWFFHALDRYLEVTHDRPTLRLLLPQLLEIVDCHQRGTRFGIGVDPQDGLLRQGQEGYQLTWMDTKVGDWVVTPRCGKAVEINALWYNALCLLAGWLRAEQDDKAAARLAACAEQVRQSFNTRFWYAEGGYLYDVVDGEQGDDPACRPNQILAFALRHPILERAKWEPVLAVVRQHLLTPVGLRSLAPSHPDYKPKYDGDLRARDAAYHQGTVWPWLLGPFIDAWLHTYPQDRAGARGFLEGLVSHLGEACLGSISEICDAEAPYTPRGCISQAWSVAEMLRCWAKTTE